MSRRITLWTSDIGDGRYVLRDVKIDVSSSGDNELVAAVPGKSIVVISVLLVASGVVSVKFKSGGTELTGPMLLGVSGGFVAEARQGLFATLPGEALNLSLHVSANIGGCLTHVAI